MNAKVESGIFIVLEGIDGCGKTTVGQKLLTYLNKKNFPAILTAEPSKGDIGRIIRANLKDNSVHPAIDALLFAADRLDHGIKEIKPALNAGKIVISDRYVDSSLVYQSIQGSDSNLTFDWIKTLNQFCIKPDRVYLLDLDPNESLKRKKTQNLNLQAEMEKFEHLEFQQKIRALFLEIAQRNLEGNHVIIDASQNPESITRNIIRDLQNQPYFREKNLL